MSLRISALSPYAWIVRLRHLLFDKNILKSKKGASATMVVGNLEFGGTGKSPHCDYLISRLKLNKEIAVLSRGYGRKSSGYVEVRADSMPSEVGDEISMLFLKNPDTRMAVCEDRLQGIQRLSSDSPVDLVLLDDAFQHRKLKGDINILLTPHGQPFWKNELFPFGSLRDIHQRAAAAEAIIITQCPELMSADNCKKLREEAKAFSDSPVFFSKYRTLRAVPMVEGESSLKPGSPIISFAGLANDQLFTNSLSKEYELLQHVPFKDHHPYSLRDIQKLKRIFDSFAHHSPSLVTTDKDAVKIKQYLGSDELTDLPIYRLPIEVEFIEGDFDKWVHEYVEADKRDSGLDQ